MTTQDQTTAIYVRTGVHSRSTDLSLAAQEQACRSYAIALGWHVGEHQLVDFDATADNQRR